MPGIVDRHEGNVAGHGKLQFLAPRQRGEVARRSRDGEGATPAFDEKVGDCSLSLSPYEGPSPAAARPPLPRFARGEEKALSEPDR